MKISGGFLDCRLQDFYDVMSKNFKHAFSTLIMRTYFVTLGTLRFLKVHILTVNPNAVQRSFFFKCNKNLFKASLLNTDFTSRR